MQTYLVSSNNNWGKSDNFIDALFNCIKQMGGADNFPEEIKVKVFSNCKPSDLIMNGLGYEWPLSSIRMEYTLKSEGAQHYLKRYNSVRSDLDDVEYEMVAYFEEQLPDEALED